MGQQKGFTLIEILVSVAVMAVLTGIVSVTVSGHFRNSQNRAYQTDKRIVQQATDAFVGRNAIPNFLGKAQYPIFGALKRGGSLYRGDDGSTPAVVQGGIAGNPLGGTMGGTPVWVDDGDAVREASEEVLNDEDSPASAPGWHVARVDLQGVTYYVDSRDYLINFDLIFAEGLLHTIPASASQDNCSASKCTGSYIYFVNPRGTVETLLSSFPVAEKTGFQQIFP